MLYFLYPQLSKLSGAERLILRLAAHTAGLGEGVTLVTRYFDLSCRPELDPRVNLAETGRRARFFRSHYLNAPFEYLDSLRLLTRVGPDAQALTFFGPPSLPALYWSRRSARRRLPHLYFCYEPPRFIYDDTQDIVARLGAAGPLARPFFGAYQALDRRMAASADFLLANSAFGAERLRAAYQRESVVITHGVDLKAPSPEQVAALRERYRLANKRVLLTVNFLHPRKRIDLFLRAFQQVHARAKDTVGLVLGKGPEQERLHALARELGLADAIVWPGFVPDGELAGYYALAHLYLHTGRQESFGLSVLEASASGLPVIAVNEGGPREIIADGETGLLTDANPEALARAAEALLTDEPRRLAFGDRARRRAADKYSWEKGACTFLDVVRRCAPGPLNA